jgi:hypothetical protein
VRHRVTLIPGDGIGPELTEATRRVLEATEVEFDWDVQYAGADVMDEHGGNPLPEHVLDSIRANGVALSSLLEKVVANWLTPPPTAEMNSPSKIAPPSTNPLSRVRGPTWPLSENVSPGRTTTPSTRSAMRWMLVTRLCPAW